MDLGAVETDQVCRASLEIVSALDLLPVIKEVVSHFFTAQLLVTKCSPEIVPDRPFKECSLSRRDCYHHLWSSFNRNTCTGDLRPGDTFYLRFVSGILK